MITLFGDNNKIPIEWIEFSDGALTCKIDPSVKDLEYYLTIMVSSRCPVKEIIERLKLIYSALDNLNFNFNVHICLKIPYLPYGRADRVFEQGNPHPLDLFLNQLGSFNFNSIKIVDPHNEEYLNHFDQLNFEIIDQAAAFLVSTYRHDFNPMKVKLWDYIIAPDKGAVDKATSISDMIETPCIYATKKRDLSTGKIVDTELSETLPSGSHVIIVDDILDGGGTFIPLAEKLRSQGCTVDLYVTHLIAAKGLDIFKGLINNIYCYHTVGRYINKTDVMYFNSGE